MQDKKKICILFRSFKLKSYSIEELFEGLRSYLVASENSNIIYYRDEVPELSRSIRDLVCNILYVRKINSDITHITGDIHYVLPFLSRKSKKVLTVHDLVSLNRTKWYSLKYWIFKYFWYIIPVKYADIVTVISEKTKRDLIALTGVNPNKVHLIHNFVKPLFEFSPKEINYERPIFLLIGGGSHKNTIRCIEALKAINKSQIILLGSFSIEVFKLLNTLQIPFKHFCNITHQEVYNLYKESDILLFPSLYEGFGMPIIEAQAVGRSCDY